MTDDRPRPQYGEYAPIPPAQQYPPPVLPVEPPVAPAVERPKRTWDVAISTALILLGVWDVVGSLATYADFATVMTQIFAQQQMGEFTAVALANQIGGVLNVVRVVILAITIVISLLLLSRGRRAVWVPLAGAVLSGLSLLIGMYIVITADPAFATYLDTLRG